MSDINEMIAEVAYERIKKSPLWHTLQNDAIDAKADELASAIQHFIDFWFESEPVVFPLEAPALRSLSEVEAERERV